jgi:ABC-type transport system involved in multi-copper enzyme maturation permease subunit
MRLILSISRTSFRRAIRSRVYLALVAFCLGLIGLSRLMESLTFTAEARIITDVGLAGIAVVSALLAILLSVDAISGEIEKKTATILFSKPVSRGQFILGSFLGVLWSIVLTVAVTGTAFVVALRLQGAPVPQSVLPALGFVFLESSVLVGVALFMSSFSSSTVTSVFLCLLVYVLGHLHPQLTYLARRVPDLLARRLLQLAGLILPNLEYFNPRQQVAAGQTIGAGYAVGAAFYGGVYVTATLCLAYLILRRREL